MKLSRNEVIGLLTAFGTMAELKGAKFSYFVAKNGEILQKEFQAIQKAIEPPTEIREYEQKRIALARQHAKKDDTGQPVVQNGRFVIANERKFRKEINDLKSRYGKWIEAEEERRKEVDAFLSEEVELPLLRIALSEVPEDISAGQMAAISKLVVED